MGEMRWHPGRPVLTLLLHVIIAFVRPFLALGWDLVPDPPFVLHHGHWQYRAAAGKQRFGHFLYSSPMGKDCKQNLTIVVQTWQCLHDMFDDGRAVSKEFANSTTCMPQAIESAAMLADAANSVHDLLVDTCVQVSALHVQSYADLFETPPEAAHDLVAASPTKHGFIGSLLTAQGSGWAEYLAGVGLPIIEVEDVDTIRADVKSATFRVRSDMTWVLRHVMEQLLPARVALLLDSGTAKDALHETKAMASVLNTTVAVVEVLPVSVDVKDDGAAWSGVLNLLNGMVSHETRYLLMIPSVQRYPSLLACGLYKMNLHHHVQVVLLGKAQFIYASLKDTPCASDVVADPTLPSRLSYEVGWLGISGANHLASYAGMDYLFKLWGNSSTSARDNTQARDLNGNHFELPLAPSNVTGACADDEAGINSSTLVRQLLRKAEGETVSCSEVAPLGHQAMQMPWLSVLAQLCPATACSYNPWSHACRLSCACDPKLPGRGTRACTTPANLGIMEAGTATSARCDGAFCRALPFAPSASSVRDKLTQYALSGRGFCPSPWVCSLWAKFWASVYMAPLVVDAVWSLVEAYRCIERRHGADGLRRLAEQEYGDSWVWEALYSCLVHDVDFEGMGGRITFGFRQSPEPGGTPPVIHTPHPAADSYTIEGLVLKDGVSLAHRAFRRRDYKACTAAAGMLSPGLFCKAPDADEYFLDRDGPPRQALPPGEPRVCDAGSYPLALEEIGLTSDGKQAGVFECVLCRPGTFKADKGAQRCSPCQPGFYAGRSGQKSCSPCDNNLKTEPARPPMALRGGQKQEFGSTACLACDAGYVSEVGSTQCSPCQAGTARPALAPSCALCPAGSFQSAAGAADCVPCASLLPGSTSVRGAMSPEECLCPRGSFARPGVGCVPCGEGLECAGGDAVPTQRAGFWGTVVDKDSRSYSLLRCRNELECPAGEVGLCPEGRVGTACSQCLPLHYKVGSGKCLQCEGQSYVLPIAAGVVAAGVLGGISYYSIIDASTQPLSTMTLVATLGQAASTLQVLSAFKQLQIQWIKPVRVLMDALSVIILDLDVVRLTCLMPSDDPIGRLVTQLLSLPACVLTLAVIRHAAKKCNRCGGQRRGEMSLANSVGFVTLTLYMSLTLTVLKPLLCVQNPNGTESMALDPGVVCWSSSVHKWLISLASAGILGYPILILSAVVRVTLMYPSLVASGRGQRALRRWRFLFQRFNGDCYYFGLLYLFRNTLVALIPVMLASVESLQLLGMSFVLLCSIVVQVSMWPWRTPLANRADCLGGIALAMFLTSGILLGSHNSEQAQYLVQWVIFAALAAAFATLPLTLALVLRQRFFRGKRYGAFLCHHKQGAGSLSRLLKMSLSSITSAPVFLDSDELQDLDLLFDHVRSDTQNLVVVLSSEVLKRMWCAGEIATAYRNNVPMVPVLCDGCLPLKKDDFRDITKWWSEEELSTLMSFDITVELIYEAYQHLAEQPSLSLPRFGNLSEKSKVAEDLVARCRLPRRKFVQPMEEGLEPKVLVAGATLDPEAYSTCEILAVNLQVELMMDTLVLHSTWQVEECASAEVLVVLLTKGLLQDEGFASVLLKALSGDKLQHPKLQVVTVLADQHFLFPDADYYRRLAQQGLGGVPGEELSWAYHWVLSSLALPFTPLASAVTISRQLADMAQRVRGLLNARSDHASGKLLQLMKSMSVTPKASATNSVGSSRRVKPSPSRAGGPSLGARSGTGPLSSSSLEGSSGSQGLTPRSATGPLSSSSLAGSSRSPDLTTRSLTGPCSSSSLEGGASPGGGAPRDAGRSVDEDHSPPGASPLKPSAISSGGLKAGSSQPFTRNMLSL